LNKFELILSQVVSSSLRGSLLQRGAPTRRASESVGSNSFFKPEKKRKKNVKNFLLNSNSATGEFKPIAYIS